MFDHYSEVQSTGDDGISMQLLKQLCQSCSFPIAIIIYMSFDQGIVPDAMKLAKVIPIFKAKKKQYSFLARCGIICDKQYGFRPNRSTIDAVTDFTSDVRSSLDRKDMRLSVYLDLSRAFDTIHLVI